MLHHLFCFDIDDHSKYIYISRSIVCKIDRVNDEANNHISNLLPLLKPKLPLPFSLNLIQFIFTLVQSNQTTQSPLQGLNYKQIYDINKTHIAM